MTVLSRKKWIPHCDRKKMKMFCKNLLNPVRRQLKANMVIVDVRVKLDLHGKVPHDDHVLDKHDHHRDNHHHHMTLIMT